MAETRFHKHDEYINYGVKTADFHRITKSFRNRILELSLADRLMLVRKLSQTGIGELSHSSITILGFSVTELQPGHFTIVDQMTDKFTSWSEVDNLCLSVLQPLLKLWRQETMELLYKFNGSPNRFKRRASVVTFTRKIAKTAKYTDTILELCEKLIWDDEDIVRKGVGWALKDNLRSAPERILPYIKKLRRRGVSSTIVHYAIRDLAGNRRQEVLAIKGLHQKSN